MCNNKIQNESTVSVITKTLQDDYPIVYITADVMGGVGTKYHPLKFFQTKQFNSTEKAAVFEVYFTFKVGSHNPASSNKHCLSPYPLVFLLQNTNCLFLK